MARQDGGDEERFPLVAAQRLRGQYDDGDLTISDPALSAIKGALKLLGWTSTPVSWAHPYDIRWSKRFTLAWRGLESRLALLHVPQSVLTAPDEVDYQRIAELIRYIISSHTTCIRIFSYNLDAPGEAFRSLFRSLRDSVDIEFQAWAVVARLEAIQAGKNPKAPSWLSSGRLEADAARRLLILP